MGLIGIEGFPDFNSKYCAKSLINTISYLNDVNINKISNYTLKLDYLSDINNLHSLTIAQSLEIEKNLSNFIKSIKANADMQKHDVLAFPPILGLMSSDEIIKEIEESLQIEIIELLSYPPSVPGMSVDQQTPCRKPDGIEKTQIQDAKKRIDKDYRDNDNKGNKHDCVDRFFPCYHDVVSVTDTLVSFPLSEQCVNDRTTEGVLAAGG